MAVILFLFVLYQFILPSLVKGVTAPITAWLPVATINECLMWAIMALGLNVVVGYAGLLDLGYVAFWALGGYTAGWLMAYPFNWTLNFHLLSPVPARAPGTHINFWLVCIIAGTLCAVLGIIIGAPTLRLRGDYLALVTLGFGEVITQFFRNSNDIAGRNVANGDPGISSIDPIGTGPLGAAGIAPKLLTNSAAGNVWKILVLGLLVGVCIFVSLRIREGRLGRAWLAIREDELAASMMGVPLVRTKLLAYAVGAFFGGVGGVANASMITTAVSPSGFDFGKSVLVLLDGGAGRHGQRLGRDRRRLPAGLAEQQRSEADRRPDRLLVRHRPRGQPAALQLPDPRPAPGADDAVPPRGPDTRATDRGFDAHGRAGPRPSRSAPTAWRPQPRPRPSSTPMRKRTP